MVLGNLIFTHTSSSHRPVIGDCAVLALMCALNPHNKSNLHVINSKFKALHTTTQDPAGSLEGLKVNLASVSKMIYSLNKYVHLLPRDGSQRLEKKHVFLGPKASSRWLLNELEGSVVTFQNHAFISHGLGKISTLRSLRNDLTGKRKIMEPTFVPPLQHTHTTT